MRVREIQFAGEGEPFLHPTFMSIVRAVKERGLRLLITTNGSRLTAENIPELVELRVDEISVSLWAGTAHSFLALHPGNDENTFHAVVSSLHQIHVLKEKQRCPFPRTKIINAICTTNCREIPEMVQLGRDAGVDEIYFRLADIAPGVESFRLTAQDASHLRETLPDLISKLDGSIPRTNLRENVLELLESGDYRGSYLLGKADKVHCYVGWYFSRIQVDGTVLPCCACEGPPLGNIHEKSFREIWNALPYQDFRRRARGDLTAPYFEKCGCFTSCPHYFSNAAIHGRFPVRCVNRIRRLLET
jgi:MoaA/NifB/PqqE/SkfB family radical SAM enzyme